MTRLVDIGLEVGGGERHTWVFLGQSSLPNPPAAKDEIATANRDVGYFARGSACEPSFRLRNPASMSIAYFI